MKVDWVLLLAILGMTVVGVINYEVGFANGRENCYGCGLFFEEPVVPSLFGPWFAEEAGVPPGEASLGVVLGEQAQRGLRGLSTGAPLRAYREAD